MAYTSGPTRNVTPGKRPAPKITPTHDAIFHTPARPVANVAPKRSPTFGPIGNVARPIVNAQRQAHQTAQKAQRQVLRGVQVPYVPKLAHPTQQQRTAGINIVSQSLRRQGAGTSVPALARGGGTRVQQQRVNRYVGAMGARQRQITARIGAVSLPKAHPVYGPPTPQAPLSFIDPLVRQAVPTPRYLPTGQDALVAQGQAVSRSLRAQALPGRAPTRLGFGPATVDLTAASRALAPYTSKALGATVGLAKAGGYLLQHGAERPLSDKSVLGRTLNDVLTYPTAAIPTAYNFAMHPEATVSAVASGVASQFAHPVQAFEQHPLFAAMLLHGSVGGLGRGIGAVGRATGADFASTSRNMIGIAGESGARLRTPRSYSKDVFRKAGQALYDKRLQPIRDAKGNVVKDARGRPVMAAPTRSVFNRPGRLQTKRADFIVSRRNAMVREARAQAARKVMQAQPTRGGGKVAAFFDRSLASQAGRLRVLPKGLYRPEKDVVAMAMQGTLRGAETFKEDLVKERQRLEDVYQQSKRGEVEMDPLQKRSNRTQARTIDRVLNDPKALRNSQGVFDSARQLAAVGNRLTGKAVDAQMLSQAAADRAKLFPYAQSHMGAKPVEHADGNVTLRGADGSFLSNEQIRAHMQDPRTGPVVDPEHIAYLPHRADVRGARAYYQQMRLGRPNLSQESRTGGAYEKGAIDTGANLPLEHITRAFTTLAGAHEFDRLIHDVGIKHPEGRYFTWKEAEQYAKRGGRAPNEATGKTLPGEPRLVPVRAFPAKYEEARAKAIQGEQDPALPGAAGKLVAEQTSRFDGPDPADPNAQNVVLVPETIAKRIQDNIGATHSFDRSFQAFTSGFRRTVLPFSTKWLTGNIVEALGRLAVAGVSPHDPYVGRKLVGEMTKQDPHAAMQVLSHLVGGLMYGERGLTNYRTGEDALGMTGGLVAHSLPGRAGGKLIKAATEPQFFFNRWFERQAQYAALGKYARRQMQELSGSWFKALHAQDQALRDVANGLRDTGAQQDAAKFLDETLGKYSRFTPKMRRLIQGYTPFLPWYLNSVRFVFHTLPVRHPVKLAILTQAEQAFQRDWQDQHRGIQGKAPDLVSAIPAKGGFVDAARYTPFGFPAPVFAGEFSQIPGAILPQISGFGMALNGLDPFGRPLTAPKSASNPKGEVKGGAKALAAINQLAGGFVPGLSSIQRLREGGGTPYSTSNVFSPQVKPARPGVPQPSAVGRVFNPFRPVYVTSDKAADPLLGKYGIKAGTNIDDLAKKYGIKKGTSVDDLAAKYGIK